MGYGNGYYGSTYYGGENIKGVVVVPMTLDYTGIPVGALRLDIFNSAGTALGGLFTAKNIAVRFALDQIGSISFSVPSTDPMAANLTGGTHVKVYHDSLGYVGEYILRKPSMNVAQTERRYEGWSLLQELVFLNTYLRRQYSDIAVSTVLSTANVSGDLYGLLYGTGWTPGTIDGSLGNISVNFEGQSIFEAIASIGNRLKKHFREGSTARTLDFGVMGVDSGIRLIVPQLATSDLIANALAGITENVDEIVDTDEIWNTVIPLGGGQGLAALTLETSTRTTPYTVQSGTNPDGSPYWYIADAASVASYGARVKVLPFTDINPLTNSDADIANAADALYDKASAYLQWYKDAHLVYTVTARQVPWSVKCGDKIRLEYRGVVTQRGADFKWADIDDLFYVMERADTFDDSGSAQTVLMLSNLGRRQIDDASIIIGALQQVQVLQTFVQPYPSAETFVYKEEIAPGHQVDIPIEFDSRVLYLNSCKVRLQTRPLRSTVTAAAGGGDSAASSRSVVPDNSQASSRSVVPDNTQASSRSTVDGGADHYHNINMRGGYTETDYVVFAATQADVSKIGHQGSGDYVVATSFTYGHHHDMTHTHQHGHDMTHTHQHGHDMTHTHDPHIHGMTYGIFDETGVYPDHISIEIDGANGAAQTAALGGPWMPSGGAMNTVLDITDYLKDSAQGLRYNHTITFTCTGGQGQVVATIRSLMTTQSITVA